jgi:hypothetical protein
MRLHHGNIVPVFDFGRAGTEYYLAMELVDGADVRALLADARASGEPLPASTAAHVAAEVARALAYAHSVRDERGNSVVHRDVKPANVLVSRSGDVRLTDFGVAAAALDADARGGTPAYMAPEQLRGEPTDARADLYALGVVLHELLSGARPAAGAIALPPTTPADVAEIVVALLRDDADGRPASAAEVARSLEAAVGRARARGDEPAPRDELGRRAARVADQQDAAADVSSGELSADASFVDTHPDGLPSRTQSTATDVPRAVAMRATASPAAAPTKARRATAPIVATLTLAAMSLALYGALRAEPAAQTVASHGAASVDGRRGTSPRPTTRRENPNARALAPTTPTVASSTPSLPLAPAPSRRLRGDGQGEEAAALARAALTPTALAPIARRLETRPLRPALPSPALPAEPALLNVNATPWAEVWIDGVSRGTTPLFGTSLAPGRHDLRFVNAPLGVERETTVTLTPGERRNLVVDLAPAQAATEAPSVMQLAHEK